MGKAEGRKERKRRVDTGHASCQFNSAWMHDDDDDDDDDEAIKEEKKKNLVREWEEKRSLEMPATIYGS